MIDEEIKNLLSANSPNIGLPRNQAVLRSVISKRALSSGKNTNMNKFLTYAGATLALVAIAATTAYQLNFTPSAKAQDALKKAAVRYRALTPEQRQAIHTKIKADMATTLEEASNAPDLKILTKEQVGFDVLPTPGLSKEKLKGFPPDKVMLFQRVQGSDTADIKEFNIKLDNPGSSAPAAGVRIMKGEKFETNLKEPVKFLRYTDDQGREVTLGVDEDNTPVMKMIKLDKPMMHTEDVIFHSK